MAQLFLLGHIERMELSRNERWRWIRGILAFVFGVALVVFSGLHITLVYDVAGCRLISFAFAAIFVLIAQSCIYISMWRDSDFEIVGWALLVVFTLLAGVWYVR